MSFFKLHDALNDKLYRAFNLGSDLAFLTNLARRKALGRNAAFRGRHSGERCFILGTGPSLSQLDSHVLEMLSRETTIGVNSLYKASVADGLVPSYYALMDNNFWGPQSDAFADIAEKYGDSAPTMITDYRARHLLQDVDNSLLLFAKHFPTEFMRYDLTGNISITMNVVSFAIACAMFMGFRDIYLIGCDYNLFCKLEDNHCYDDNEESAKLPGYSLGFYLKYYALTTEIHYKIRETAAKDGFNIVNLTSGSLLDAYQKQDVENVFDNSP